MAYLRGEKKIRGQQNAVAGESHFCAKLNRDLVIKLRQLNEKGICLRCAVRFLNVKISYSAAWDAANYKTWRHIYERTD